MRSKTKIAPNVRGRFYVRRLLIFLFACFFGPSLIDSVALAQEPKLATSTVPNNKYGEGGTKVTKWEDKFPFRVYLETWTNERGDDVVTHIIPHQGATVLPKYE